MGGYYVEELTKEELLEWAKEEYDDIQWDEESLIDENDCLAVWGWDKYGTYMVAVAYRYERSDEEVDDLIDLQENLSKPTLDVLNDRQMSFEEEMLLKRGWFIKFMYEEEGPIIQPSSAFLKNRPPAVPREKTELPEWLKECLLGPDDII